MRGVRIVYALAKVLVMRRSGVRLPKAAPFSQVIPEGSGLVNLLFGCWIFFWSSVGAPG